VRNPIYENLPDEDRTQKGNECCHKDNVNNNSSYLSFFIFLKYFTKKREKSFTILRSLFKNSLFFGRKKEKTLKT